MNSSRTAIISCVTILALCGILFPSWLLALSALAIAALTGLSFFAVALGIIFDIAYGAPAGIFHSFFFPFTLCALVAIAVRALSMKYIIEKTPQNTI